MLSREALLALVERREHELIAQREEARLRLRAAKLGICPKCGHDMRATPLEPKYTGIRYDCGTCNHIEQENWPS